MSVTEPEHLTLPVGRVIYSVKTRRRYEVTKIDNTGAYVCYFDGSCSDIIHIWHGMLEEEFSKIFADSYKQASEMNVISAETKAKLLRNSFKNILKMT